MSRPAIEAFALRAVGEAVKGYADSIPRDSDFTRIDLIDEHVQKHLYHLAEHLDTLAHEVAHEAKISRIMNR